MNTLFKIMLEQLEQQHDMMLVTIIDEAGSSPRGKGSQMLVSSEGQLCGTIGGGAVEKQSEILALELLTAKMTSTHHYELRRNSGEDIGMACGGDVTVHFQYVDAGEPVWRDLAEEAIRRITDRKKGWLVLNVNGDVPFISDDDANGGEGTFAMSLPIGERAILFGGGHVSKALAPILHSVGFRITVMDDREEFVTTERFPMAEERIVGDYTQLDNYLQLDENDYIVVMTNGHANDYDVEEKVLRTETAYVGVIGSTKKTAVVNEKLRAAGIDEDKIARVHTPIGIDIKATTPEEIAISVTGEMVLVRAERRAEGGTKACPMSM